MRNAKIDYPIKICKAVNEHFVNIGKMLFPVILNSSESFEDESNVLSMFLELNKIETKIENIIDQWDSLKASGCDMISVKIIKTVKFKISTVLLFIIVPGL